MDTSATTSESVGRRRPGGDQLERRVEASRVAGGEELLGVGRAAGSASPRGCGLGVEEAVGGGRGRCGRPRWRRRWSCRESSCPHSIVHDRIVQAVCEALCTSHPQLDLDAQLCFPLYAATRAVTRRYGRCWPTSGSPPRSTSAAGAVEDRGPLSVGELGGGCASTGTLTPLLKRLEGRALVRRRDATTSARARAS